MTYHNISKHAHKLDGRTRFVSRMRRFGDGFLFPTLAIIASILVPSTIIIPVIVK